jgi:hypothetical protein
MTQNTAPNNQTANSGTKKPNETGSIRVEGFVRIFDPKTRQVFVEKRA